MNPFLSGMLAACTAAQISAGAFFVVVYARGRREAEYLLFGLVCLALALLTGGIAWAYAERAPATWGGYVRVAHAGAIVATGLNLHFVLRYAGVYRRWHTRVIYPVVAFYELMNALGIWFRVDRPRHLNSQILGRVVEHYVAAPTPLATSFYVVAGLALITSCLLLIGNVLAGKRESMLASLGALALVFCAANDALLVSGAIENTLYLLPYGFLVYAFGVAVTLVSRYQETAGELAQTTSSLAQAEEELRHSHAELIQVQSELSSKQALAAVGELAAAIAHEVRNPLAVIVNAVAGLRRNSMREADREMLLSIVDEETARLNRLVTDLLRFARPVNIRRSAVSLVELVQRSKTLEKDGHSVAIAAIDDPEVQSVELDPGLVGLVFDNLVENAFQAMPSGGIVYIDIDRGELSGLPAVRVAVRDSGHGMDPSVLENALRPFFTTRPSGTGLGLPIVQRIVEAHGGRLELVSRPGVGTIVRVLLPLKPAEKLPSDHPERRA